ncbi:hypothetical protein ACQKFK_32585 [Bacillus mycoides]|uniref:hypothetical protein n=1 Tax=Bacillus mycoides TaxID=1405 RepID=UPI003D05F5DC
MQKRQLLNLNEGDCIYVYSGGKLEGRERLEGQGRYVCVVEDKNESFLCWRKHNGNEVYTNLNGISVETMNENTAYLENTRETCERDYVYDQGYNDTYPQYNQNADNTYDQSYNNYDQDMENTYQPSYNNGYDSSYNNTYEPKHDCNCNTEYNTYDQNMDNTNDQVHNNYNQNYNNYNHYPNDMYNQEYNNDYNQNSGCTCKQCYNQNYPK